MLDDGPEYERKRQAQDTGDVPRWAQWVIMAYVVAAIAVGLYGAAGGFRG